MNSITLNITDDKYERILEILKEPTKSAATQIACEHKNGWINFDGVEKKCLQCTHREKLNCGDNLNWKDPSYTCGGTSCVNCKDQPSSLSEVNEAYDTFLETGAKDIKEQNTGSRTAIALDRVKNLANINSIPKEPTSKEIDYKEDHKIDFTEGSEHPYHCSVCTLTSISEDAFSEYECKAIDN